MGLYNIIRVDCGNFLFSLMLLWLVLDLVGSIVVTMSYSVSCQPQTNHLRTVTSHDVHVKSTKVLLNGHLGCPLYCGGILPVKLFSLSSDTELSYSLFLLKVIRLLLIKK